MCLCAITVTVTQPSTLALVTDQHALEEVERNRTAVVREVGFEGVGLALGPAVDGLGYGFLGYLTHDLCVCVCVCMCVCVCGWVGGCAHARARVCVCVCVHTFVRVV